MSSKTPKWLKKLPDYLLGLSLLSWAIAGIWADFLENQVFFAVRISLALLQACVGILILFRKSAFEEGSIGALLKSLPSFLISGLLFRLAMPLSSWPIISKYVFATAVAGVLFSFWSLRSSFAILPARRATVNSGLYRFLRHPAYFFELIMAAACTWAAQNIWALISFIILVPMLALRIIEEEKLMQNDPEYREFQKQSPWRLIPWIW